MNSRHQELLVSVVMIFYNAQRFMDEAIESVAEQTYPWVELLLCDDGSSDRSAALAKAWAARHPGRIRYLEHPGHEHLGMSATRNLGTGAARGELVAFLDADDLWKPEHVARQVDALLAHPGAAGVCGRALDWHSWNGTEGRDVWSPLAWPAGTVVEPPRMLTAVLRAGEYSTPVCSLLVSKKVLQEVGGSEDVFTGMFEDQVLLAKIYLTTPLVLEGAKTALYRQHSGSSTAVAIRKGEYDPGAENRSREIYLRWLQQQPQLAGPTADDELQVALADALRPYDHSFARLRWQATGCFRTLRRRVGSTLKAVKIGGRPWA